MEQILNKLSEIELTAQRIMEDCDRQKQQLSEEAEQKCKNYDEQLETRTAEQIRRIRQQLEEEKDSRLAQLRADTDATFSSLDAHYEQSRWLMRRATNAIMTTGIKVMAKPTAIQMAPSGRITVSKKCAPASSPRQAR